MNTAKEQLKNDLRKDPQELEQEADGVRADLEKTVDELMQQFSPSELLNQGMSLFRRKGNFDFVRNLNSQVQNNPIPTLLVGVGVIWLMSASKQPPVHEGASISDTIGKKLGATRDRLSAATGGLRSSSQGVAEHAREKGDQVARGAGDVVHRVGDASRNTSESVRSGIRNARDGYTQVLREQPLLVGVLAVAAGAALGALLPRTSTEDRMVGDLSDRGADALKEKTEEKLKAEQGKAASESASDGDASATGTPPSRASSKAESGVSGEGGSPARTEDGQSSSRPDPAPYGTGRDSDKTHHGTHY